MKNFWLACLIIVICRLLAAYILPTFDDAFITYRYAFNLANGHGLVYNPGEKVMGTTAPLFALLSTIPFFLSLPVPKFFLFFNLLCDLGTLWLVYKYFFKGKANGLFFLFTCLFALDSMVSRVSIGGMEADLFLFISLSGLILYLNGRKNLAAVILAAAYFLRPEAVIMLFIVFCYECYTTRRIPFKQGILSLFVLGLPLLCIYLYFGQVLPQSVIAKSTMAREPFLPLLKSIFFPDPLFFLVFPLAIYGFIQFFKKDSLLLLSGCWTFLFGLAYLVKAPHAWSWYFFSIDSLQLLFACFGVDALLTKYRSDWQLPPFLKVALLVIPVLVWMGVLAVKGRSGVEKNIYSELQKDCKEIAPFPGKIFFADDIGALGYFSRAYIYDNQKLVTPQAARYNETYDRIVNTRPDYLFIYTNPHYLQVIHWDTLLAPKYSFVKRYAIGGEKDFPTDRTGLSTDYKQDYMLFKRND